MGKDIREMFREEEKKVFLPKDHRKEFKKKLMKELHQKHYNEFYAIKIAVAVLLIFSLGFWGFQYTSRGEKGQGMVQSQSKKDPNVSSIADISPDLKRVEDFYSVRINYQLSKIRITDENKELLKIYFSQISELQKEYDDLNKQLGNEEISEKVIDAIIENLQLRLELLLSLKKKLKILENLKVKQNGSKSI